MPISEIHTYEDGSKVGWDVDKGEWVPLDAEAEGGSFLGNAGRAAARSTEELALGAGLYGSTGAEAQQLQGEILRGQQEAQERSAPWASMIGGAAPDVAAGLAIAPLTGGLGLGGMLAAEGGVGGLLGALRTAGSFEERIGNAALGAAGAAGGAALAPLAAAGIGGALRVFGALERKTLGRVATEVDEASGRLRLADDAARGPGSVADDAQLEPGGAGSVGAARTPAAAIAPPPGQALEERGVNEKEAAGAESASPAFTKKLDRVIGETGYQPPIGQGTRTMSGARLGQAVREFAP